MAAAYSRLPRPSARLWAPLLSPRSLPCVSGAGGGARINSRRSSRRREAAAAALTRVRGLGPEQGLRLLCGRLSRRRRLPVHLTCLEVCALLVIGLLPSCLVDRFLQLLTQPLQVGTSVPSRLISKTTAGTAGTGTTDRASSAKGTAL